MTDPTPKPDDTATTPYAPEPYVSPSSDPQPAAAPAAEAADAEAAPAAPAPADPATTPAEAPARRSRRGWVIGGIAAGGVLALALSFGGGLLVGLNTGHVGGFATVSDHHPAGPGFGSDGDRPGPGGDRYDDRDADD